MLCNCALLCISSQLRLGNSMLVIWNQCGWDKNQQALKIRSFFFLIRSCLWFCWLSRPKVIKNILHRLHLKVSSCSYYLVNSTQRRGNILPEYSKTIIQFSKEVTSLMPKLSCNIRLPASFILLLNLKENNIHIGLYLFIHWSYRLAKDARVWQKIMESVLPKLAIYMEFTIKCTIHFIPCKLHDINPLFQQLFLKKHVYTHTHFWRAGC